MPKCLINEDHLVCETPRYNLIFILWMRNKLMCIWKYPWANTCTSYGDIIINQEPYICIIFIAIYHFNTHLGVWEKIDETLLPVMYIIGNLRTTTTALSTTTGSELQCTAQAQLVNFVIVVSSTTPNIVESRRPAIHKLWHV